MSSIHKNLHKFMAVPAILLFIVFFIYPLSYGLGLSFTDWDGLSATKNYVGFQNFTDFFQDRRAIGDIKNTLMFGLISPILLNVFGFLLALLLDKEIKGKNLARTIIYLPAIISPLIMGYVWLMILRPDSGFLFNVLQALNLENVYANWLVDPHKAMWAIIIVNLWQFIGYPMIIFLAGLQSIPTEMYEAAKIDGASSLQTIRYITIPQLMPAIQINIITNIINSLSVFEIIVALTNGGPGYYTEPLSLYIYRNAFAGLTGYSTAVAMVLFIIILIPVALAFKFFKYDNN